MKILNQTSDGQIGKVLHKETWLTQEELQQLEEIKKTRLEE